MMRRHIFSILLLTLSCTVWSQGIPTRYVLTTENGGIYANDGESWATAKNNIQEAIASLQIAMEQEGATVGRVFVGAGVYVPTASTEQNDNHIQFTSFIIPAGIEVYGGFTPTGQKGKLKDDANGKHPGDDGYVPTYEYSGDYQLSPEDRYMSDGTPWAVNSGLTAETGKRREWDLRDQTILNGSHAEQKEGFLTHTAGAHTYVATFPNNSYHVVWFASNGFLDAEGDGTEQRGRALDRQAVLDGCCITGGNAAYNDVYTKARTHTAYGGGAYLVGNSVLRNCRVYENSALLRGGGVYLDGGGLVDHCFIQRNQSLGQGLTDGFGGGACVDYNGTVRLSMIVDNAARIGGGLAITMNRTEYPDCQPATDGNPAGANYVNAFSPTAAGCVVANNTATTEGGGMMMQHGGTANHMTVARNHCAGAQVTTSGHRYGRTGGLYIDVGGVFLNSVVWGNTTASNGNTQYAAFISTDAADRALEIAPYLYYSAIADYEEADWTGTSTSGVIPLQNGNARPSSTRGTQFYYPEFILPSSLTDEGCAGVAAAGAENTTNWSPAGYSDLVGKGLRMADFLTNRSVGMGNARLNVDIYGHPLSPRSCLGAYNPVALKFVPATAVADIEGNGATVKTFFVDPAFQRASTYNNSQDHGSVDEADVRPQRAPGMDGGDTGIGWGEGSSGAKPVESDERGNSWDNPLVFLGDAIYAAKKLLADDPTAIIQIVIKEGNVSVEDRSTNENYDPNDVTTMTRLRDLTIDVPSNVRIYGGYPAGLTYINLTQTVNGGTLKRDPLLYPTILSANVTGMTYADNVAHVVTLNNATGAIVDGLHIEGGNTTLQSNMLERWAPAHTDGAGILVIGGSDNKVRNCAIANCTTSNGQGAAIYVNGTTGMQFDNLVVHNNTSVPDPAATQQPAAVMVTGGATATFDHCLFRGNVGGVLSDGSAVTITNSAMHANTTADKGGEAVEGTLTATDILATLTANGGTISGTNNQVDTYAAASTGFLPVFTYDMQDNADQTYPSFVNPTKFIGASQTGHITYYGGLPNFMPRNLNPMVNKCDPTASTDMSVTTPRNVGGKGDIGPIECTTQMPVGEILYVRMPADGGLDGTSTPLGTSGMQFTYGIDDDGVQHDGLSWDKAFATITYALDVARYNNADPNSEVTVKEIWVAAGTYAENLTLTAAHEGINVRGGFVAKGNPSNQIGDPAKETNVERNIANKYDEYKTIIDGNATGRVLHQTENFTRETIWEGLTFRNGAMTAGNSATRDNNGAGVRIMDNMTMRNCLIRDNLLTVTGASAGSFNCGGGGLYMEGSHCKLMSCIIRNNTIITNGSCAAAGAYIFGGTFINSLIVENTIDRTSNTANGNILAAGAYVAKKADFYQCTFAYNYTNNAKNDSKAAATGGLWDAEKTSQLYNCIFWGNYSYGDTSENFNQVGMPGYTAHAGLSNENFHNCYHSTLHASTACDDAGNPALTFLTDPTCAPAGADVQDNRLVKYDVERFVEDCRTNSPLDEDYNINSDAFTSRYCINMGNPTYGDVLAQMGIEEDIMGADRIQDCTIDKGAYEFDGSNLITPDLASEPGKAIYYVTELGAGTASAANPQNAACWRKLQKVLDAAGRYQYNILTDTDDTNDDLDIVVRVAQFDGYAPTRELYYDESGDALVTSSSSNARAFTHLVPRGITLEGGWNDEYDPDKSLNFQRRDVTGTQSVLNGIYQSAGVDVNAYHVVSFTSNVYGINGLPMGLEDGALKELTATDLKNHATVARLPETAGRAIIDGLFITNGVADGQDDGMIHSFATAIDRINAYKPDNSGGAAIVPSYGHVRNCIIENNRASGNGGALLLKPKALVSGCIIRNNYAGGSGGGIAVYEPTAEEKADPTVQAPNPADPGATLEQPAFAGPDYSYSNIFCTTIAGNEAANSGGGIRFTDNLRVNSTVLWRNTANSGANISGNLDPGATSDRNRAPWEFPMQYCSVENVKAPGFNNFELATLAVMGTRWDWDGYETYDGAEDLSLMADEDQYYGLHVYSMLARSGMLIRDYKTLRTAGYWLTLESHDIMGVSRTMKYKYNPDPNPDPYTDEYILKNYIEIGARAFKGEVLPEPKAGMLMPRIFVGKPLKEDLPVADRLIENAEKPGANDMAQYYGQMGSSMAYPMNYLTDALEYVRTARKLASKAADGTKESHWNDQNFEIFVGPGTYVPTQIVKGAYSHTRANTYLVPEGVAIYGGIGTSADYYFCAEGDQYIGRRTDQTGTVAATDASKPLAIVNGDDAGHPTTNPDGTASYWPDTYEIVPGVRFIKARTADILSTRPVYDVNQNSIIEGWDLLYQTILSGDIMNSTSTDNAFHVITANAAEQYVGKLPTATSGITEEAWLHGTGTTKPASSYVQRGQRIILDGLQICDGQAIGYADPVNSLSTYYKGGGICIDGNWHSEKATDGTGSVTYTDKFWQTSLAGYKPAEVEEFSQNDHDRAKRSVGYRDIPLIIRNSLITNNQACMGGALFTNGELQVYSSQFVHNLAQMAEDKNLDMSRVGLGTRDMVYYGRGGAIDAQFLAVMVNTIFANNTAQSDEGVHEYTNDEGQTYEIPNSIGGAVSCGEHAALEVMNCDFVRNEAGGYPAIYCYAPNAGYGRTGYELTNSTNETEIQENITHLLEWNRHAIINTLFWGNDNTIDNSKSAAASHYDWVMNPVSSFRYKGSFDSDGDNIVSFDVPQALWFCAYEKGTWYEPKNLPNTEDDNDFRRMPYYDGTINRQTLFVPHIIKTHRSTWATNHGVTDIDRYDFNIELSSNNDDADGPNFVNPSHEPGIRGYMPEADWMMGRINNIVDQGWTYMKPMADNKTFDEENEYNNGPYLTIASTVNGNYKYDRYTMMPYGNTSYMKHASALDDKMLRISLDQAPSHGQSYIDIGAYEYQHVKLMPDVGDWVNVIWVTQTERLGDGVCDGSTWRKATSDLQSAIETLLGSRNGHRKEIRITEGTYAPVYKINNNMAFTVSTLLPETNNYVALPSEEDLKKEFGSIAGIPEYLGIRSLTIRGGYSKSIEEMYNPVDNPVVLKMNTKVGATTDLYQHTFIVEDAQQRMSMYEKATNNGETIYHTDNIIHSTADYPVPVILEGITFSNDQTFVHNDGTDDTPAYGGSAIYYKDAAYTAPADSTKLKLINSIVTDTREHPAVTIGTGGGKSLVMNTLFHNNATNEDYVPTAGLVPYSLDADNTVVLNCTFADNRAGIQLTGNDSELHNSILWRNGDNRLLDDKATTASAAQEYTFTPSAADKFTHNAILAYHKSDDTNATLGLVNDNLQNGPNFTDRANHDYTVLPSALITSQGDIATYEAKAGIADITDIKDRIKTDEQINDRGLNYVHLADYNAYLDLAGLPRKYGRGLELGAYETTGSAEQRVFYVTDDKVVEKPDGLTWETSYDRTGLQTAINAAAVWHILNGEHKHKAYVFVRSNNGYMGDITLQNGVEVYGSLPMTFGTDSYEAKTDGTYRDLEYNTAYERYMIKDYDKDTKKLNQYVSLVLNQSDYAMASPRARLAHVYSVTASGPGIKTLLHGFDIDGSSHADGTPNTDRPAVAIDVAPVNEGDSVSAVMLRNCIIHDFTADGTNTAAVTMKGGSMLYNCLLRDNVGTVNLESKDAYLLNCSVSGVGAKIEDTDTEEQKAAKRTVIHYAGGATAADNVLSSVESHYPTVDENGKVTATGPFTPCFTQMPHLDDEFDTDEKREGWKTYFEAKNMQYQLNSAATDKMHQTVGSLTDLREMFFAEVRKQDNNGDFIDGYDRRSYIDYATDRDLLGNPRQQVPGYIDMGCFETWNAPSGVGLTTTMQKEGLAVDGTNISHQYPHLGSVAYIRDRGYISVEDGTFDPVYLLAEEGGSLYGNGHTVNLPYVSVERNIRARYALVSLPYAFDPTTTHITALDDNHAVIPTDMAIASYYDGDERAKVNYKFVTTNADNDNVTSLCWQATYTTIPANRGWSLDLGGKSDSNGAADRMIRFTAMGTGSSDYVYTEAPSEATRAVKLYKHDKQTWAENDDDVTGFTHEYNSGWNLFGMPWLVSYYGTKANMSLPSILYSLDNTCAYNTTEGWDDNAKASLGEGYFMQLATVVNDSVNVRFKRPVAPDATPTPAPARHGITLTDGTMTDALVLHPSDRAEYIGYTVGADGAKFLSPDADMPQLYASTRDGYALSLASAAPVGHDIPLGMRLTAADSLTIALSAPEAWGEHHVWLTDHDMRTVTDLCADAYTFAPAADDDQTETTDGERATDATRFTLRIGGQRPELPRALDDEFTTYAIRVSGGHVIVSGLDLGDSVIVYKPDGTLHANETATSATVTVPVHPHTVYIVTVNGRAHKIRS